MVDAFRKTQAGGYGSRLKAGTTHIKSAGDQRTQRYFFCP